MNSEQIANIIYDAIDLAVSKQVADAGYDKTIQAQILECLDATTGKYYVQYQDSKFTAYAENIEVVYPINSTVLILIPNNDWTQEKVIVGAKTKKSINYVSNVSPYINIEDNLVGEWLENFGIYGNQKTQVLYDSTTNLIDFDADTFNELAKQNQYISIAAMFRTEIPRSQRYNGTYGIKVTLNNTVLTFDIDDMIGTPYSFNTNTKQSKVYEINSETFTNIEKIELFIDFPLGDPVIVYLSHLELNVARKMNDAEIAGPWLYIIPNYKGTFTSSVDNITLNTEIYIKRQKIDSSTQPLSYYWFRENLDAVEGHVDYLNYGGKGWQCINSFTPIEYDDNGVVSKKNWVTNQSTISLKKEDFNIKKTTIKCVVIYDEETKLNAETIIINNDAPNYDLKIKSAHGENFNFNIEGGNTLTCEIFTREGDNLTQIIDVSNYEFTWVKEDVNNSFTRVKSWTKGDNQYKVDFSSLRLNATFKCEVKQIINGVATLLGTASIKLQNAAAEETLYQLIISNNSQLFKYDASGRSPASSFNTTPQPILPLDFTLYDATSNPIDKTKISNIQWSYPTKDSFITEVTIGEEPDEGKERLPYPLSFKILSKFNGNYSPQEKITLSVVYNGKTYQAEANMLFLKDGDSGTNGTDMFCRIVPVVQSTEKEYPMITSLDFSKNTLYNNYKVELYKNGSLIDSNSYTVDWGIWKSETDKALYKFTDAGKIALGDIINNAAGVLKATVNFNGKKYYAAYPLIYLQYLKETNTPVIKLKYGTGFSEVTYDANGNFPAYKGSNDFTIEVENNENLNITWATSNLQLIIDKTKNLSATISAIDSIDGLTLNNNIICNIDNIAIMYIPIHMALNKFGLANINEWDGTSVEINEDGEYILTPQVGAGEKDANNAFTGLVMGKVKTSNITDIGLFGYSHGARSIFLDAKTGKAEFGLPDSKIIIDPTNGQARITGGGYSETTKTGMLIDLAEPAIKWGNGNFSVSKEGEILAKKGQIANCIINEKGELEVPAANIKNKLSANQIETTTISFTDLKGGADLQKTVSDNGEAISQEAKRAKEAEEKLSGAIKGVSDGLTAYVKADTTGEQTSWKLTKDAFLIYSKASSTASDVEVLRVDKNGLKVTGAITATSGTFNNCTIEDTCTIKGKLAFSNLPDNVATQEFATNKASDAEKNAKTAASGYASTAETNAKSAAQGYANTAESNAKTAAQGYASTAESNAKGHTNDEITKVNASIAAVNGGLAAKVSNESGTASFGWVIKTDQFTIKGNNEEVLKVTSSGLSVKGAVTATSGTFNNCTINSSCTIKGKLSGASGDFTGTITATSGSFENGSIGNLTLTDKLLWENGCYISPTSDNKQIYYLSFPGFVVGDYGVELEGVITANAGTFNYCTINDTCTIKGVLTGNAISSLSSPNLKYYDEQLDWGSARGFLKFSSKSEGSSQSFEQFDRYELRMESYPEGSSRLAFSSLQMTMRYDINYGTTVGQFALDSNDGEGSYSYVQSAINDSGALELRGSTGTWLYGNVYGTVSPGTGSDANKKYNIELLSDKYQILFNNLIPRRYKYKDGTSNRMHSGFIAQEVQQALDKAGLTTQEFAAYLEIKEPNENKTYLALRYEEFIALNTYMIQKQQKRIDELETAVELLKNKLNRLI